MSSRSFDVFQLHAKVMEDYRSFVSSYLNIHDDRIREKVNEGIESQRFWPAPLIRFNPAYEMGGDAVSLNIITKT